MDTSTPVSKQKSHILCGGLKRKAIENDCERNSNISHSNVHISPEEDADLIYSQQPNDSRLNRSEELFPFSPIAFRKEVPSTLLPLLDTPDTRWTSSLFTSFHAQSENTSPEVLSEDNFVRSVCVDSQVENNVKYTTNSNFNSEVPSFSNDTNIANVLPNSFVEKNSSRPSPPIVITRKKEKKFSSVTKELFPFRAANDISQEQSSLDCSAMGDMTLNALEKICIDSEIMYSKNSSKKSNTVNTSFGDEAESHFVPDSSAVLDENSLIRLKNKRNFIYPYDDVKKPVTAVLATDIMRTVLLLETNETSTKVSKINNNFRPGLVCFSQLEPSLSQSAGNSSFSSTLTVGCDTEFENHNRITTSYEIVRVIYLPVFFCSSDQMSPSDRDMLTILKRYFENRRIHFTHLIFNRRRRARRDLSSSFIKCCHSKFPKLNFSAAIIDSFFEFFVLHPDLIYNYRLSRRSCVTSNQSRRESQYCSRVEPNLLEVCQSLMKLDQKSDYTSNEISSIEAPIYQKIDKMEKDFIEDVSGTAAIHQNPFPADRHSFSNVPMTSNHMQLFCIESESKITCEQTDGRNEDRTNERLAFQKSTLSSPEKLLLEVIATVNKVREKRNYLDNDLLDQIKILLELSKKLLENVTNKQTVASEKQRPEKSEEKCYLVRTCDNVCEKFDIRIHNSSESISKTPFDVDIDSADLMFICDLSEKTALPERSLNSPDVEPFSRKIAKVTEKSPQHYHESLKNLSKNSSSMESPCSVPSEKKVSAKASLICDSMKNSNLTATSAGFSNVNHSSPSLVSNVTPVMRSFNKKCTSESSSERSVIAPQKSLTHVQTMVLDDIENWNPEVAVMMTPDEIKKQLIHTRSSKKDVGSSSSNLEDVSTFTNKSAFDGFNTAGGKKIGVQLNSLIRAKKSMDDVQVEPNTMEEQFSNPQLMSGAGVRNKMDKNPDSKNHHINNVSKSNTLAEKSSYRPLSKPANDSKLNTANDDLLPKFSTNEMSGSSGEDYQRNVKFTSDESSNRISELLNTECCINQFPSFSTASGRKMNISDKFLAKGKKIFESTAEEKSIDEIKPNRDLSSSQLPPDNSCQTGKTKSRETNLVSAHEHSKPSILKKPFASPILNKSEAESYHQLGGFCSAAGKKLAATEKSRKGAEKLYASILNEISTENAQDLQFASFSSASGKETCVTETSLKKEKKQYESTSKEATLCDPKSIEKSVDFAKPVQLATKTAKKMSVTNEALQKAHKLFDNCFDEECLNDLMFNPANPASGPQFSTFTSAAGKVISVAEKRLSNAQKIFQSVSAETVVSMEKMGNFKDGLHPHERKIPSDCKQSDVDTSEAAPCHQRLKRSFNEDTLQNAPCCSSSAGKKLKTDENVLEFSEKSDKVVGEFKPDREILKIPPAASILELPTDCELPVDSFSFFSGEEVFQKSPSLDDTVLLNSDIILSDTEIKADCDLPAMESAACVASHSSIKNFAADDTTLVNLSQEISESASAFLFDMKNDNLTFGPGHSSSHSDAVDEPKVKVATTATSRSSSPVFDSSKPSHKRKYKKRRSQHSLSLNPLEVTYVRKESDHAVDRKSSPEEVLKMLNQNFAQKVNKRKEPSSNLMYPSSKKAKDFNDSILEQRKQAALEQQKLVSQKDEQLCKPRVGSILTEKLHGNRKSLREMVNYEKPKRYSVSKLLQFGMKRSVVNVNADNANEFIFTADFLSAEETSYGDECIVIPNEKHEVYFEDLARAFLASPGVDPRLISLPWIRNHYRWIIWKLASTEKSYPNVFGGRYLTLNNVLLQLKFRYDWEVDRCCRSALKRILECDSSPSETMILCVASIKTIVATLNEYEIEMTDGWYSVPCLFDGEMMKLLTQKKVTVGTKLMIMNAELTGAGDGCDPLQPNHNARLKIATNSVRRARWYAPLGFYGGNPIVISDLRAILPNGGIVPQFIAVITRVYPMLYLDKKDDGSFTLHNEKVHFKKMADFEKRRQLCVDSLISQITSEVERENSSMDGDDRNTDSDSDLIAYQNRRYQEQDRLKILIQEKLQQRLPEEFKIPKRASSMLKVRLVNKDVQGDPLPTALLTIWSPSEDVVSLLSEGKMFEFQKVVAGGLRNGHIQLNTNRLTKYKHLSVGGQSCYGRRFTPFSELNTDFKAVFGEVDIVGLVVCVKEITGEAKNYSSQTIYLADLDKNLMVVKFGSSVKDFGFEDKLKLKNVIAGLNLQWKRNLCNGQIPITFASELTSFVHYSRCEHLQKCIDKFHHYFKNESVDDFVAECTNRLKDILTTPGPIATSTPQRSNNRPSYVNENSVSAESTNDASLRKNSSADCSDGSWNAKSKNVHSRIEKLRGYGEPPPLSPISLCPRRKSSRLSIQTRVHKLSISKN